MTPEPASYAEIRAALTELAAALRRFHEDGFATMVETAASGADEAVASFLVSNELWGGAGSIADQAVGSGRSAGRREIERRLIELGVKQMQAGTVNVRTGSWVHAFEHWAELDAK